MEVAPWHLVAPFCKSRSWKASSGETFVEECHKVPRCHRYLLKPTNKT